MKMLIMQTVLFKVFLHIWLPQNAPSCFGQGVGVCFLLYMLSCFLWSSSWMIRAGGSANLCCVILVSCYLCAFHLLNLLRCYKFLRKNLKLFFF